MHYLRELWQLHFALLLAIVMLIVALILFFLHMQRNKKERELAKIHDELNEVAQIKLLSQERERIMREVHDGFGAHLIGALAMLESNQVDSQQLIDYLKTSLLDLRLMIDSLDPNISDVSIALSMLRSRVEPILRSSQIDVVWDLNDIPDDLELNANKTLCLLRVLQELITNTIKHSLANRIVVRAQVTKYSNSRKLIIHYWENGAGFDSARGSDGRGLRNIHQRMHELRGAIAYRKQADGFEAIISIPGFPQAQA